MPPVSIKTYRFFFSVLLATAFISGIRLSLGALNLTLSHIAALAILGFLLVRKDGSFTLIYKDKVSLFLYLYFLTNLIPSILFSPNRAASIKGSMLILSYVFIYQVARHLTAKVNDIVYCIRKTVQFNNISVGFGLISMLLAFVFKGQELLGISYGHLNTAGIDNLGSSVPSIRSFSMEPNLFAEITASVLCLYIAMYVLDKKMVLKKHAVLAAIVLSLIFAYTRSVYIAVLIALLFLFGLSKRIKRKHLLVYLPLAVVTFTGLFMLLPEKSSVVVALKGRFTTIVDFEDGSGLGRIEAYLLGFEGFLKHPILGNGTLSADTEFFNAFKGEYEHMLDSPGWLAGAFMQCMHDSGIMGLIVLIGLYYHILRTNYRGFKYAVNNTHKNIFLGFLCAHIIIIICSQLSSALWITFSYIFLGINIELARQMQTSEKALPAGMILSH